MEFTFEKLQDTLGKKVQNIMCTTGIAVNNNNNNNN